MKLLSEKEIEYVAKDFSVNIKENSLTGNNTGKEQYKVGRKIGFKAGALFAEQKLLPLICEFSEWCIKNGVITLNRKATQQLLEQFIKEQQL